MNRKPRNARGWRRICGTVVVSQTQFPQQGSNVEFLLQLPYGALGRPPLLGGDQLVVHIGRVDGCTEPQESDVGLSGADAQFWIFPAHIVDQRS